jgi:hypothetical protein
MSGVSSLTLEKIGNANQVSEGSDRLSKSVRTRDGDFRDK